MSRVNFKGADSSSTGLYFVLLLLLINLQAHALAVEFGCKPFKV